MARRFSYGLAVRLIRDCQRDIAAIGALLGTPGGLGILRYPGVRALLLHRCIEAARRHRWASPGGPLLSAAQLTLHGLEISSGAIVGEGVFFVHTVGNVIGAETRLGAGCMIYGSVTCGNRNEPHTGPSIGAGVTIGAGARLLGRISIGDGARIGANSVVIDDVLPGQSVAGVPAVPTTRL
jgi:serine O-acetyltransferase